MLKAYIAAPYKIAHTEVAMPQITPTQVLLKVIRVGVCGSDTQTYHGLHPTRNHFPLDFGHEAACVVVKCGEQIRDYQVGDRVAVEPQQYCGQCYPCRSGRFNVCERLKVTSVYFCEYVATEEYMLHHCPPDMSFDKIALTEPLAVALGSVKRSHYQNAKICVVGAGTIGNLTAQVALKLGASQVMITDLIDSKLDYAHRCGIQHCVNTGKLPLKEAIEQAFGQDRADVIIDCAASAAGFATIIEASRPSSQIVITGNYKQKVELDLTRLQRREVSLVGHMMYVYQDFEDAIRLLYENRVYTDDFVSRHFPLSEAQQALEYIDQHSQQTLKVIIDVAAPEL